MHVPDGFLDAPTSARHRAAVAVVGVGVALRGAAGELDDRTAPLAGLVATFVFAAQMLNFPVGAGTSGHLLGGALAAVLVGPCDRPSSASAWCCSCRPAVRRRRHHRARHQHHPDGRWSTVVGRLAASSGGLQAVLPKRRAWSRRSRPSRRSSRCRWPRSASSASYAVGGAAPRPARRPGHGDGRRGTCSSASARP